MSSRPSTRREVELALGAVEAAAAGGFAARAAGLEDVERHVLDRLRYIEERAALPPALEKLRAQADSLRERLEGRNERFVRRLRDRIITGRSTPEGLRRAFVRYPGPPGKACTYDTLDLLVALLLGAGGPLEKRATLEPEMVGYQPTPARAVVQLIERAAIRRRDTVYDLGSGLGHVVILVALLSGARARGIELEPAYCEYAAKCARRLRTPGVSFAQADARDASLDEGTVFFMYTPFRGALLQEVLERLHGEAQQRAIRICTYGQCTKEVARAGWLRRPDDRDLTAHEVAVFHAGPTACRSR